MTVGAVLRRLRKALGLTLEEMAERAGTDAANLSRIERGKQSYTPEAHDHHWNAYLLPWSTSQSY